MPVLPEMVTPAPPLPPPPFALPMPRLTLDTTSPEPRGSRRGFVIAAAVIAAVLLSGGAVVGVSRLFAETPQSTVEDYFDALADGDAASAMKLVYRSAEIDTRQYPLLTDAGLSDDTRPTDVEIGDVQESSPAFGQEAQFVEVKYSAGGTDVTQDVLVAKAVDGDGYRLRAPFVAISLNGLHDRTIKINGVEVDTDNDVVGFPGSFKAEAAGNALIAGSTATATPKRSGRGGYVAELDFGRPELAPGAQEEIESSVRATIDQCAATTEARTAGCPFTLSIWGSDISVKWSVTTYPAITVESATGGWMGGGSGVTFSDDGSGKVDWTASYTDFFGTRRTESGNAAFRVGGTAKASPSGIQVSLT
ncbi:hypothetical protein O7600_07605 [Micromonospora sp. WMMA1998]|uniref:hypothetical protein n=1 Tax=Micromonospora sp. WMMA1998 TaxID=3015167 RepID=UPI00248D2825|nr:hypothetical protein [Micromonospora sp. WMMA1998]WBC16696.1 hypothetical protein O7600_07605 [Micromonospora sp. WMMA1998]